MAESRRKRRSPSSARLRAAARKTGGAPKQTPSRGTEAQKGPVPRNIKGGTGIHKKPDETSTQTPNVRKKRSSDMIRRGGTSTNMKAAGKRSGSDRKRKRDGAGSDTAANRAVGKSSGSGRGSGKRKSGGRRGPGLSLWIKFAAPVVILILGIILVWGNIVSRRTKAMLVNEIKKDGASGVQMLALQGRPILEAYQRAKENEEFKQGVYFPVDMGLVTEKDFVAAMGIEDGSRPDNWSEFYQGLKNARILKGFSFYDKQEINGQPVRNEVLNAVINADHFVAGSHKATAASIKPDEWLKVETPLPVVRIGERKVDLSLSGIKVYPGLYISGAVTEKVLVFEKNFAGGVAILALSADVIETELSSLTSSMYMVGLIALLVSTVTCVSIAQWVVKPAKILIKDMNIVAGGNLDHKTRAHSTDEIGQIAVEFNEMTRKLLVAHEAEKEAERLENELDMAREIQMKLLPPRVPSVKGLDMDAVYKPAKEVGGDYYDFFPIDKEHLGIIVADVSGKGIPGSMVMATTRTILRFVASGNTSAADTLAKTNAIVAADIKRGMFVTAFYLVFDARRRTLLCSSAGHNPMVVVRSNNQVELVNPNGIALGFDKGPIFQRTIKEQQIQLQQGDRIVLYTDGVVEAMNSKNEEYTDERFYAFCKKAQELDSKGFIKALLADLDSHKGKADQHDDITIVTIKVL